MYMPINFEEKLEKYQGNLHRSAVEMAKDWRTDKMLRRLEAMLIVADKENFLLLSGTGDVIEPDDEILAIGSSAMFADGRLLNRPSGRSTQREVMSAIGVFYKN